MFDKGALLLLFSVGSVCLFVYLSLRNTITFESFHLKVLFGIQVLFEGYRSSSYMKVIGSRSRSQEQKARNSLFPQRKTSIGNNSCSMQDIAVKFACSMAFSATGDRMVRPPSLSRDRTCRHSRVVCIRSESNLVTFYFRVKSPRCLLI